MPTWSHVFYECILQNVYMLTYIQTKVYMRSQTSHVHFKMSSSWQNNSRRCHEIVDKLHSKWRSWYLNVDKSKKNKTFWHVSLELTQQWVYHMRFYTILYLLISETETSCNEIHSIRTVHDIIRFIHMKNKSIYPCEIRAIFSPLIFHGSPIWARVIPL